MPPVAYRASMRTRQCGAYSNSAVRPKGRRGDELWRLGACVRIALGLAAEQPVPQRWMILRTKW